MIRFAVYGLPAPQGSKKFVGMRTGKRGQDVPQLVESSKKVKPWRKAVHDRAAMLVLERRMQPLDGPLAVVLTFTMPKPASAPKSRRTWPCVMPDASKLARSTEDALTDAGMWTDDARIVSLAVHKRYPLEGPDSLERPGVVITIAPADRYDVELVEILDEAPPQGALL